MGDACISGELKLPLMRYEVSLVPEHVAKRNVKDPLYIRQNLLERDFLFDKPFIIVENEEQVLIYLFIVSKRVVRVR